MRLLRRIKLAWYFAGRIERAERELREPPPTPPIGDGKAEFLGDDMTEDEFREYEKRELEGWGTFFDGFIPRRRG